MSVLDQAGSYGKIAYVVTTSAEIAFYAHAPVKGQLKQHIDLFRQELRGVRASAVQELGAQQTTSRHVAGNYERAAKEITLREVDARAELARTMTSKFPAKCWRTKAVSLR